MSVQNACHKCQYDKVLAVNCVTIILCVSNQFVYVQIVHRSSLPVYPSETTEVSGNSMLRCDARSLLKLLQVIRVLWVVDDGLCNARQRSVPSLRMQAFFGRYSITVCIESFGALTLLAALTDRASGPWKSCNNSPWMFISGRPVEGRRNLEWSLVKYAG